MDFCTGYFWWRDPVADALRLVLSNRPLFLRDPVGSGAAVRFHMTAFPLATFFVVLFDTFRQSPPGFDPEVTSPPFDFALLFLCASISGIRFPLPLSYPCVSFSLQKIIFPY